MTLSVLILTTFTIHRSFTLVCHSKYSFVLLIICTTDSSIHRIAFIYYRTFFAFLMFISYYSQFSLVKCSLVKCRTKPATIYQHFSVHYALTMYQHFRVITVCTVVQNCCKGDSPCQWKIPILDPQESKTPQPIDIKLYRGDYVGDLTPHAHFGISTLKGGGAAYA